MAGVTDGLLDNCLIVGGLALAAWTALIAISGQSGFAGQITATTRNLLLTGAGVLVLAPILLRKTDRALSYFLRSSALYVGLTAVGQSFASIGHDLLAGAPGDALAVVVAATLAVRDVADILADRRIFNAVRAAASGNAVPRPGSPESDQLKAARLGMSKTLLRLSRGGNHSRPGQG